MKREMLTEIAEIGLPILAGSGSLDARADALISATQRLLERWEAEEQAIAAAQAAARAEAEASRLAAARQADPQLAERVARRRAERLANTKL